MNFKWKKWTQGFVFAVAFLVWSFILPSCAPRGEIFASAMQDSAFESDDLEELEEEEEKAESYPSESSTNRAAFAYVYVCGAVESPGVYELPEGSRIYLAIEAAGGMKPYAAEDAINLAEPVSDGMQIRVPTEAEFLQSQNQIVQGFDADGRVNLNTATVEQLMTLPGVGESKAQSIVKYREDHGEFTSTEDIMKISGIKEGLFARISEQICV